MGRIPAVVPAEVAMPQGGGVFRVACGLLDQGLALVTSVIAFDGWFCISFASKQRWG